MRHNNKSAKFGTRFYIWVNLKEVNGVDKF